MIYDVCWGTPPRINFGEDHWSWNSKGTLSPAAKEVGGQLGDLIDFRKLLAEMILETKDNSFVFVITRLQTVEFESWLDQYGLRDLVVRSSGLVSNEQHTPRGISLWVLMTKEHWYRDLGKDDPEITEENFINFVDWPKDDDAES
jgi:hypothetical protein